MVTTGHLHRNPIPVSPPLCNLGKDAYPSTILVCNFMTLGQKQCLLVAQQEEVNQLTYVKFLEQCLELSKALKTSVTIPGKVTKGSEKSSHQVPLQSNICQHMGPTQAPCQVTGCSEEDRNGKEAAGRAKEDTFHLHASVTASHY